MRRLTSRELAVVRRLALGMESHEIGTELGISATTVKTHIQNVMTKLGVHTRLGAVAIARRAGALDGSRSVRRPSDEGDEG